MDLFSPLTLRSITFKNRIAVSPMCQYSCVDGFATDWHLVHLGSRAVGGAGLVIMEATAIEPAGRISPGDMGIWDDAHVEKLSQISAFIDQYGAVAGIQLAHAGRKASISSPWEGNRPLSVEQGGWSPIIAPSAIAFDAESQTPQALSVDDIRTLVQSFAAATTRALKAGFKVIEIHSAHGYLLHEFLSPLSNQRSDEYGSSFENRCRFLLEVTQAVRAVMPDTLPLFVRISASDWVEGGWDIEQSVALSKALKPLGVDLIDASSGGTVDYAKIQTGPGYQVPFAEAIKHGAEIPTGAVGMITEAAQANQIIQNKQADMVLLARELLRDPYWPLHAAKALGVDIDWPPQYQRAKPRLSSALK